MNSKKENLNRDEQRVAELIGTLRQVDAPGDFEARVRAGIAGRRAEKSRPFWLPVLAGGAAVAVLGFAGYLGLRSLNSSRTELPAEVANTATTAPAPVIQPQPSAAVPVPSVAPQTPDMVAADKQPKDTKIAPPAQQGGSIDEASKDTRKLYPKNSDPSQRRSGDSGGLGGQIPVTMIFEAIGIHAAWNGSWQVNSVDPNNVAGRSGVHAGDIVEAINGEPVGEKTSFRATVTGKSLRVRRDGTVIELPFKP